MPMTLVACRNLGLHRFQLLHQHQDPPHRRPARRIAVPPKYLRIDQSCLRFAVSAAGGGHGDATAVPGTATSALHLLHLLPMRTDPLPLVASLPKLWKDALPRALLVPHGPDSVCFDWLL